MKPYKNMNAGNTALLVIDPVNGCCAEDCESPEIGIKFSKIREMISRLNLFIEKFRKNIGGLVIFTNITPWTKRYLPSNIQELYESDPETTYYSDDTSGYEEKFHVIKPLDEDVVITKNTYDAFANPKLNEILKNKNIKYLIITGVFTDGCVLASVCGGFRDGYNFVILKDLVETTDIKERQDLQQHLINYTFPIIYGKTINSEEFLNNWIES